MMPKKKSIAIIPARGGSKGIPHKNTAKICGKPMIAYTIECAIKSRVFDRVIVSTDDNKIAAISKKYGAEIIKRPPELAQDSTPTLPVLKHALKILKKQNYEPDFVFLLQLTSPLRKADEIIKVSKLMETGKYASIIAVADYPFKAPLIMEKNNEVKFLNKSDLSKRRQDFGKLYKVTGSIYAYKTSSLLGMKKHVFETRVYGFKTSELTSIDIDTKEDLLIAEALIRNME